MLIFERLGLERSDRVGFAPYRLIVAGWAGRDSAAIEHHIQELEAIGVPRPSSVPVYYRTGAALLTQKERVEVLGPHTSGEVEPFLMAMADGLWVGIASDHTDRQAETVGIALSKQLCAKPVSTQLWRWDDVSGHWDDLIIRSWIEEDGNARLLYQEGGVSSLKNPMDLIGGLPADTSFETGSAMLCGTVPVLGGIRPSTRFEMELYDPVLERSIRHVYLPTVLSVIS